MTLALYELSKIFFKIIIWIEIKMQLAMNFIDQSHAQLARLFSSANSKVVLGMNEINYWNLLKTKLEWNGLSP